MNKEELLTNGICPKCYRPLYVSKTTDAVLCDCDDVVPKTLGQKLKEIRDKWFFPKYSYRLEGNGTPDCYPKELFFNNTEFTKAIQFIQSETYQLGRQEVIDEITRHVTNKTFARKGELLIFPSDIYDKLNNLKK